MKIQKIQYIENNTFNQKQKTKFGTKPQTNSTNNISLPHAYMDFNINFRGRTPEDFYAQEFNIKYMPVTMKEYLNTDYEKRKHIPPEQVMNESFKYLNITSNFSDVKNIYKDENLFQNLHTPSDKIRTGLLAEIKDAKEIENVPLFKDETDDLGIYILRKIYLEGKTIKEINKDFYEKDINPSYKGILTEPITHKVTSAFGIQYPKTDFWNSFIATRDEYKKFFVELPKHSKEDLIKELSKTTNTTDTKTKPSYIQKTLDKTNNNNKEVRKYKLKDYQKKHLKNDIKNHSKGDTEAIKKSIRKQFRQDDPEAHFIIKYFSPIMTIAADKIHLSQEEREFAESEKSKGIKIENLFAQFWNKKPELLDFYSTAITDTIDLFEETYANGGHIPINKDFEVITETSENKKAIDFVSQDFLELLNHVQNIGTTRISRLKQHANLEKEWNEHFIWRYGELNDETIKPENLKTEESNQLLDKIAKDHGTRVITLKSKKGDDIKLFGDFDDKLKAYISLVYPALPSKFINLITNKCIKDPRFTDEVKLRAAIHTDPQLEIIDDKDIISDDDLRTMIQDISKKYNNQRAVGTIVSVERMALKSEKPQSIYRLLLGETSEEDKLEINKMMQLALNDNEEETEIKNKLYDSYLKPLSNKETRDIANKMIETLNKFSLNSLYDKTSVAYNKPDMIKNIGNVQKNIAIDPSFAKDLKTILQTCNLPNFSRAILCENIPYKYKKVQEEAITAIILDICLKK